MQDYEYDSFGKLHDQKYRIKQPYTYTGREWDKDAKLYYYRARYYDAEVGRFITRDPIGFAGGDINLYGYVRNNPVNWIDPWGLASCTYSISRGTMNCTSNTGVSHSWSGFVSGTSVYQNDPDYTSVYNAGPIPIGGYTWSGQGSSPSRRRLKPDSLTDTQGRSNLQTHSCSSGPETCSTGCIAGDVTELNELIDAEPGSRLNVIP